MSGEYYCIEEVGESAIYHGEFNAKTHRSSKGDLLNLYNSGDHDDNSTSTKKSQEYQLLEIEEQLQIAENRCNTLKNQLDSMKKNYQIKSPRDSVQPKKKHETHTRSRAQRKRAVLTQPSTSQGLTTATHPQIDYDDSNENFPPRSSSSSAVPDDIPKAKASQPPLFRQNSTSIGTDHTGAAVKTINNILSGITDSVNKLSQFQPSHDCTLKYAYIEQPFSNDIGGSCSIAGTPFSPRLNKRLYEQQKKVAEMVKESQFYTISDAKPQGDRTSSVSIKSKETALEKWSKHVSGQFKNKVVARSAECNTKVRPPRTGISEDDSQSMFKKRKRIIKRLKATSKISLSRKISDPDTHSRKFSTENIVELYHNIAAKSSDSDNSNRPHVDTRQGAGDVSSNKLPSSYHVSRTDAASIFNKSGSRIMQSPRVLTPIEENITMENSIVRRDYFHHIPKNYELPTISSKLKRVTKNYLRSFNYFNFRCIPFCAAKSTSPSHNIGINIQQVMSIIKTRQPISGISPTLAHNISLAAEKLQGSPLSAFVSNLSTKIGSGNSTCPLIKHHVNYHKLQEMAKAIPEEEPYEEENNEADLNDSISKDITGINGTEWHKEDNESSPPLQTIWSSPHDSTHCTCISQKGVPFHQVLSKYQIASSEVTPFRQETKHHPPCRQVRSAYYNNSKQRTAAWVSNGIKENISTNIIQQSKPEDNQQQQQLRGKEKNLKAVLKNLHDEFDTLNTRYEKLSNSDSKTNPDNLKQLEEMETQLNQKEEEINMVMSLYTEVMALKDQVKKLRERTSCETLYTASSPEKADGNAAVHLTHLLRQIQNYQNRYQNKA